MFRVSPEAAASAATFNARSKQARPQPSQSDGFSALVDSNSPDSQRDATSTQDTQTQRLDGGDTPPKTDNRADTRADSQPDGKSKQALDASKSDTNSDSKPNTGTGAKTNSKIDAKSDAKTSAKANAKADANAGKDGANAATADATSSTGEAAAAANAGKVEIAIDATAVVAPGDTAKVNAAKLSADDKTKDANATDAATPVVPVVLTDAAAIVAVAIPVAAATAQATTPAPKTDMQIAGIDAASNQSAAAVLTLATVATSVAAAAETKTVAISNTPATPAIPTASSANSPAVATDAVSTGTDTSVAASEDGAAKTAAAKTLAQPLVASDLASPELEVAAAESGAAQPVSPTKPKAASVSANTDRTALNETDAKTDSPSAPLLPGQTGEAKATRGAEHIKGDSDKTAAPADNSDVAPSDTKQANAPAAAAPAPVEHHAPAVARAVPADLNLQPGQTQQTQPLQAQTPNLTVTPAVQITTLANTPVPVSGLAVDIALRAAGGSSRFEIRLDPAELGRIDVRLDVDKHGNVTSHLTVEKPATLDMLRRDAPQLQQALEDAGLKTGDGGLQFSLRDQSSSRNDDNGSGRDSQRLIISEDDTVPAQVAGRTYGRALGSSSGVDIRV